LNLFKKDRLKIAKVLEFNLNNNFEKIVEKNDKFKKFVNQFYNDI